MNYIRYQPLSLVRELQQELFPLLCLKERAESVNNPLWAPEVDVKIQDNKLWVMMDVPGVETKDINIEVHDNVLSIEGERQEEQKESQANFYKVERKRGKFLRQIALPYPVEETKIQAKIKNGVLTIELPQLVEKQQRKRRVSETGSIKQLC